uniref:Cation/H+ exchanger transmembrane domain-containing protein n=1 Tax=Attheya septentrionalis TaxID=420275 RepID=A0A7S2XPS4_9STRA
MTADDQDNGTDVLIDDFFENWECCSFIREYYRGSCHESSFAPWTLFGIILVLVLCGVAKSLLQTFHLPWVPDAAACITVGAFVGGSICLVNPNFDFATFSFDNNLFLRILLPPIVFECALSIDKKAFRRDFFPILMYAVIGTVLSSGAIGMMVYLISGATSMTNIPLLDSLLFGSLISSIDPVATLGVLNSVGVGTSETLYTLVFGESLLNDGVSIVLFDTLVRHLGDSEVLGRTTIRESVTHFLIITAGSILIGLISGICCAFYYWKLRGAHTAVAEVSLFFCWALIPYYLSDCIGWSGILSIMSAGFFMDYCVIGHRDQSQTQDTDATTRMTDNEPPTNPRDWHPTATSNGLSGHPLFSPNGHLSAESRQHIGFVAKVISSLMETTIFAYLGLFLFSERFKGNFMLGSTGIFACVASRFVVVILISLVINIFVFFDVQAKITNWWQSSDDIDERDTKSDGSQYAYITKDMQIVLFCSGVRGAVSLALVESIPVYNIVTQEGSAFKAELKAMTSASILFTIIVLGAATYKVLKHQQLERYIHRNTDNGLGDPLMGSEIDDLHMETVDSESPREYVSLSSIYGQHTGRRAGSFVQT